MTEDTNQNIKNVKEELLKEIRLIETKLNFKVDENSSKMKDLRNDNDSKFEQMLNKNKEILTSIIDHQLKLDKIEEFETFKNKINDMIITHEIRINNSIEDINEMKAKYDKAINENLTLPSFFNSTSQFKNIGEYISYNINDMSKLKGDRDLLKKEIKDTRAKIDSLLATTLSLVNNSVARCNEYCNENIKNLEKSTETKFKEVTLKLDKIEEIISNNQVQLQNQIIKLNKDINNINNNINVNIKKDIAKIKPDYTELIELKTKIFPPLFKEINKKIDNISEQIRNLKVIFNRCDSKTTSFDNIVKDIRSRYVKIYKDIYHNKKLFSPKNSPSSAEKKDNDEKNNFSQNDSNTLLQNLMFNNNENTVLKFNPKKRNSVINSVNYNNLYSGNKTLTKDENNSTHSKLVIDEETVHSKYNSNLHLAKVNDIENKINNGDINNINNINNNINSNYSDISEKNNIKPDLQEENLSNINLNQIKERNSISELFKKDNNDNILNSKKKELNDYNNKNENKSASQMIKNKIEQLNCTNLIISKKQNLSKYIFNNKQFVKSSQDIPLINNNQKSENITLSNNISKKNLKKEKKIIKSGTPNENDYAIDGYCYNNTHNTPNKGKNKQERGNVYKLASLGYNSNCNTDPIEVYSMAAKHSTKKRLINLDLISPLSIKFSCFKHPKTNSSDKKMLDGPYKIGSVFGRTTYNFYNKKEEVYNNLMAISQNIKMNKNEKHHENDINISLAPVAKLKIYKDI